jgi:hypothetical protein
MRFIVQRVQFRPPSDDVQRAFPGTLLAVRFARNYPERTTKLVMENPIGLEDYRFKVPAQAAASGEPKPSQRAIMPL